MAQLTNFGTGTLQRLHISFDEHQTVEVVHEGLEATSQLFVSCAVFVPSRQVLAVGGVSRDEGTGAVTSVSFWEVGNASWRW